MCVKTKKLHNCGLFSTCEDCHWRGLCLSLHGHLVEDLCLVILVIFIILVVTTNMIETFVWLAQWTWWWLTPVWLSKLLHIYLWFSWRHPRNRPVWLSLWTRTCSEALTSPPGQNIIAISSNIKYVGSFIFAMSWCILSWSARLSFIHGSVAPKQ